MSRLTRFAWGAALVAVAGCGGGSGGETPQSPLDKDQAGERVEEHIAGAVQVLPDSLELEPVGSTVSATCEPEELVTVSKRYWLDGLPPEDNKRHVEALHEYWTGNGYTVEEDPRPDRLFVSVRHDEDGFRMSVRSSAQEDLAISASSPCLDPSGAGE